MMVVRVGAGSGLWEAVTITIIIIIIISIIVIVIIRSSISSISSIITTHSLPPRAR
jgi:hypothetical protein